MKNFVQINNNDISLLGLKDILSLLPPKYFTYSWALFEIEAIGNLGHGRSMPKFANEVLNYSGGMPFNWIELNELSNKLEDIIDIIITGNQNRIDKPYEGEHELIQSSEILIEFFDSSYWRIYSTDDEVLDVIRASFSDTNLLKYPEEF